MNTEHESIEGKIHEDYSTHTHSSPSEAPIQAEGLLNIPRPTVAMDAGEQKNLPVQELAQDDETNSRPTAPVDVTVISIIDESGQFKPNWWKNSEGLAEMGKTLKKFKTPEALAKSYAELEKLRSYPETADEEKMAKFRNLMGLPEKIQDYKLTRPELNEGQENWWDPDLADKISATAYKYAIPQVALQELANVFTQEQLQHFEKHFEEENREWAQRRQESLSELKQRWGNQCRHKLDKASATLQQLCQEANLDVSTLAQDRSIGINTDFILLLDHIGNLINDAPLKGQEGSQSTAFNEAMRMESDPRHPLYEAYMDHNHPNHAYANSLYDKAVMTRV